MAIELYAQADRWAGYRITVGNYSGYVSGSVLTTGAGVEAGTVGNPLYVNVASGGGGAVTIADGADAAEGAKADAAYAGSGSASLVAIGKGVYGLLAAALPAGTNIIGKVGIDQTTPGTTNGVSATGNVASGVADAGAPVKIGGKIATSPSLGTNGNRTDAWFGVFGQLMVGGNLLASSDGQQNTIIHLSDPSTNARALAVATSVFNGSTWDRARGDVSASFTKSPPLAGTDRSITASTTSQQLMAANTTRTKFYVKNDSAIDVWLNIGATAVGSAGSGNIKVAASGGYFEFTGSSSAINIIAASATPAITAREF